MLKIETVVSNDACDALAHELNDFLEFTSAKMVGERPGCTEHTTRAYVVLRGLLKRVKDHIGQNETEEREQRERTLRRDTPSVRERRTVSADGA
jgi:hypothetical protein